MAVYPKFQDSSTRIGRRRWQYGKKNHPFFLFLPGGAEAFRRDNPSAKVVFYDTGHFALENSDAVGKIGAEIRAF